MATGFIGTSSTSGLSSNTTTAGAYLSYTCPVTGGVRYAVVSITANISIDEVTTGTGVATVTAGILSLTSFGYLQTPADRSINSLSESYSVILAPGQTWTGQAIISCTSANSDRYMSANLKASVLEVL